jgi:hypothetical protein
MISVSSLSLSAVLWSLFLFLSLSACSGCDVAQSKPVAGGEERVVVDVVDGVPSALDVNGGFYLVPKESWDLYSEAGSSAVVRVSESGDVVTLHGQGKPPVVLEGPIRCE